MLGGRDSILIGLLVLFWLQSLKLCRLFREFGTRMSLGMLK